MFTLTVGSPPATTASLQTSSTRLSPSAVLRDTSHTRGRPGAGMLPDSDLLVSDWTSLESETARLNQVVPALNMMMINEKYVLWSHLMSGLEGADILLPSLDWTTTWTAFIDRYLVNYNTRLWIPNISIKHLTLSRSFCSVCDNWTLLEAGEAMVWPLHYWLCFITEDILMLIRTDDAGYYDWVSLIN